LITAFHKLCFAWITKNGNQLKETFKKSFARGSYDNNLKKNSFSGEKICLNQDFQNEILSNIADVTRIGSIRCHSRPHGIGDIS